MNILQELYYGDYCVSSLPASPACRESSRKLSALLDQIEDSMGLEFQETLFDAISAHELADGLDLYRHGLRFGVQLMLVALGEP